MGAPLERRYKDIISYLGKELRSYSNRCSFARTVSANIEVKPYKSMITVPVRTEFTPKEVIVQCEKSEIYMGFSFECKIDEEDVSFNYWNNFLSRLYYRTSSVDDGLKKEVEKYLGKSLEDRWSFSYHELDNALSSSPIHDIIASAVLDEESLDKIEKDVNKGIRLQDRDFKGLKSRRDFLPIYIIRPNKGGIDYCGKEYSWDKVSTGNQKRKLVTFGDIKDCYRALRYAIEYAPTEILIMPVDLT